jgi:hypothetical protein
MSDQQTLAETCLVSQPYSAFSNSEDSNIFATPRICQFSQSVLSAEAWFRTADELTAAMDLLEPHIKAFWEDFRSLILVVDETNAAPLKSRKSNAPSKSRKSGVQSNYALINQHMMLAGFAIENLCKGYLAGRLSHEERKDVQKGFLPKSLKSHDILKLVKQTGMTLAETERYLLNRITEAVLWRGRYPSGGSHEQLRPFAQIGSDIRHIKTLLRKVRRHVGAKS